MPGRSSRSRIRWRPIQPRATGSSGLRSATADFSTTAPLIVEQPQASSPSIGDFSPSGVAPMTLFAALKSIGLPYLPDLSPEDELIELLCRAGEVEHGLMVQYLYGMYSAPAGVGGRLKDIAVEEMGHFITVQNLLVAGGKPPHIGRYDQSVDAAFDPFPFRLEPASRLSIAKYTVCEMPDKCGPHIDPDQAALLPDILTDATRSGGAVPMRVGLLYAAIYWLLREDDNKRPNPADEPWDGFPVEWIAADPKFANRHVDKDFFKDTFKRQAKPDDWKTNLNSVIVKRIAGRSDALDAIAEISEQGEGFGGTPAGHFDQFVAAYRLAREPMHAALPVPTNPWYGEQTSGDPANKITSPDGAMFAELGDRLYELMLLATVLYLVLPDEAGDPLRAKVAKAAIDTMAQGLRQVCQLIVKIERDPVQPNPPALTSHVGFALPPIEADQSPAAVVKRIRSAIDAGSRIADNIASTTKVPLRKVTARAIGTLLRDNIRPVFDQL